MSRFDDDGVRHFSARQSVLAIGIVAVILLLFSGGSVLTAAKEERPGTTREVLTAVGKPSSWVAGSLPLQRVASRATSNLSPDAELDPEASFTVAGNTPAGRDVMPITASSFDPVELGEQGLTRTPLRKLLVTGDSLSQPLDVELARRLSGEGVEVIRDAHVGTGISNDTLVDWGQLSKSQIRKHSPDAVVVFIGANEGYPLPVPGGSERPCCSADWAAAYANRVRQVMTNFRQNGKTRVFWMTVPTPREPARQRISNVVNLAVNVAAEPWRDQIAIIDTVPVFTPGNRYRASMAVAGRSQIVRESDGIHLNETGSGEAAELVISRLEKNFTFKDE